MSPKQDGYYEFIPNVRMGYRPDTVYGETLDGQPEFGVELTVEGKDGDGNWVEAERTPSADIRLYGPGDVTGVEPEQVVRVEPEPDTSTMAPNYFPFLEFDRADLPWLFSPERANADDGGKVRPWLCLAVLEATHPGVSIEATGKKPCPALTAPRAALPPIDQTWAWAHVQVTDNPSQRELRRIVRGPSNKAVARLICPRNLDSNTRYIAAVVPTFEPGRRAGLGMEPFESDSDRSIEPAWGTDGEESVTLPIYYQWEFSTANEGDFESAVGKLEPVELSDYGVGKRTVDTSDPGPPQLADSDTTFEVGGALMSPALDQQPFPATNGSDTAKRLTLRTLLNDPDSIVEDGDSSLPVVGPPVYGQWYLPADANWTVDEGLPTPPPVPTEGSSYFDAWIHELNVDPRWRIPAGYGTEVIQDRQEELMEKAWKRFGDLGLANERAGRGQLADLVGNNLKRRFESRPEDVVGHGDRMRDFEEIRDRIASAGDIPDQGAIGEGPGKRVQTALSGTEPAVSDRQLAARLGRQGALAVDGEAATELDSAQRLNQLRLAGSDALRSDGAGALPDPTALARYRTVTSPGYRRVRRSTKGTDTAGFTDRIGQSFSANTQAELGGRFASVASGPGGEGTTADSPAQPGSVAGGPDAGSTDWRLGPDGEVMSLVEAVDHLDGSLATVPNAVLAVESTRDYCTTARERLRELRGQLGDGDGATEGAVTAVTQRPTVEDQCRAIRENTFDALDRRFGKLLATDPEPLSASFSNADKKAGMDRLRDAHDRLLTAVRDASDAIQGGSAPTATVAGHLDRAESALGDITAGLDDLAGAIDSGVPPSAAASRDGAQPSGTQPLMGSLSDGTASQEQTHMAALSAQQTRLLEGTDGLPGLLDAGGWAKEHVAMSLGSGVKDRDVALAPILAAPEFEQPMYSRLQALDEQYLLPGVEKIPKNSIGALQTNPEFIEAFMCGLNHEMARELQWRRYPTDRRGTYFRQFWNYIDNPQQKDIEKIHTWGTNALGENRPPDIEDNRVVLVVRGDLLRKHPNTRIYAVKAVKQQRDDGTWDRIPLVESLRQKALEDIRQSTDDPVLSAYSESELTRSSWQPKEPVFRGTLDPDITFLGFNLPASTAEGNTLEETDDSDDLGWFFVFEERVGETRFGYDKPTGGDYGTVPYGITHGPDGDIRKMDTEAYNGDVEKGWNALSWGHLVDSESELAEKTHVDVTGDRPAGGAGDPWAVEDGKPWTTFTSEKWDRKDAAEWGKNSAHMARIAWQLPVRVCIHADDILPQLSREGIRFDFLTSGGGDR